MDKSKIRGQINDFCKQSLIDGRLIGAKPAILPIFLGKETEQTVNASLKDAFAGIFQTELDTFDICISDAEVDAEQLFQQVVDQLRRAQNAGSSTDSFKVPIIALMDETFFQEDSLPLTETIRTVFRRLENNRLAGKVAFYGVFRQSEKEGINYQNAFAFVNAGKDIWRNIYHISKSVRVHRTDCKELLKSIITSYESVNMNRDIMEQCIGKALEDMEGAYEKQLASQKNQNLEIKNETDLEKYLKREYQDKKEKFLVQEKIRLLGEIKKLLKEQGLNSILESIRKENDDYQNVLRELSGEYGGTPEQQTVPNVSEQITVNEPVEFVLRKLQMDLNILDAEMLRQFLNRVTEIMPHKHLLGRINDQYRDLEEITVKLLLQPEMIGDPTIVGIINNWPVSTNALYRNNTFYVISSRRYTSELAINDYSRG